jgi:CubicO group peptidase (beta-lactamase class C family)
MVAALAMAAYLLVAGQAQSAPEVSALDNEIAAPASPSSSPQPPPDAAPSAAYLERAIAEIPGRITAYLAETGVPGLAIAVVHGGKIVYAQGFGVADQGTGAKVDADTVFQLASMSKPIGSTVISSQVTAGKVSWHSKVTDKLPAFALGDPVATSMLTIADLYDHSSGLPDHAGDDLEGLGFDRKTVLNRLRHLPLTPFRASYAYTNYGLTAGALAAANAAGTDWATLSRKAIYAPLSMTRTTSSHDEYLAMPNHAVGHSDVDGTWGVTQPQYDADDASPAAGVASSANDIAKWMAMLLAGGKAPDGTQLIDLKVLADSMQTHNVVEPRPDGLAAANAYYGYGFATGTTASGLKFATHAGAFAQGTSTNFEIIPALDLGVVVLTNGFPMGLPETVALEFLEIAEHGAVQQNWWGFYQAAFAAMLESAFGSSVDGKPPANPAAARPLADYAGKYRNDYYGDAVVTVDGGTLRMHMGPADQGKDWTLQHWDGNTFWLLQGTPDASATTRSAIKFDFSGATPTLWNEYYHGKSAGKGTLTRVE